MAKDGTIELPPGRGATRWAAIAARLREDLAAGTFRPGERLPNEVELAARFDVNRHTLRQAVQALARDGHVVIRQGSGTYVRELVLDYALQKRTRMSENLASVGERARRDVLATRVAAAGAFASSLRVPVRRPAEWLRTRASVRGRPISVSTSVFPRPHFTGMAEAVARHGTITAALRDFGVRDYTRARSVVSTRLPTQDEADALARPPTQPVLVVHYCNVDRDGVPIEAGATLFAGDAVQLTVEPEER